MTIRLPNLSLKLPVLVKKDNGGYFAWVPGWDDVYAPGDTEEEALRNIVETVIAVTISYVKHGDSIPVGMVCKEGVNSRITPHLIDVDVPVSVKVPHEEMYA